MSQQINKSIILDAIKKSQPISRAAISKTTRLARPTVSRLVDSLITDRLVAEVGRGKAGPGGGRKPTLITFNADSYYVVGVELGVTNTYAVVTNLEATVSAAVRFSTARDDRDSTIRCLLEAIRTVISESKVTHERLIGIGLGIHGHSDVETGIVHSAPHLVGWQDVPIGQILERETGLPCLVDNDVRAETIAELSLGAARARQNAVGFHIGTGIGLGIIIDGQLYRGCGKSAGPIGHITVVDDGAPCRCGNRGCLETVLAVPAIEAEGLRAVRARPDSLLAELANGDPRRMTFELVFEAARRGDQAALSVVKGLGRHIGAAAALIINFYNPEMIVLMGPVARRCDMVMEQIRTVAIERTRGVATPNVQIVQGTLDEKRGAIGAAILILEHKHQRLGFVLAESPGAIRVASGR